MYFAGTQRPTAEQRAPNSGGTMDEDDEFLFFDYEYDEEGFTLSTNMSDQQVVDMLVEQFIQRDTEGKVH